MLPLSWKMVKELLNNMQRRKKRTFVLLEVLIAFALLSISILPFLRYPYQHMKKELHLLFEMELERIAQNELGKWQENIYKKNDALATRIFHQEKTSPLISSDPYDVKLSKKIKRTYTKNVYIQWEKQKESENKLRSSLVSIKVEFAAPKHLKLPVFSREAQIVAQKKF